MTAPSAPTPSGYLANDGVAYERFLGRWTQRLAEPFLDFADVPPEGDLLDVGCGTGSLSLAMAARWPSRRIIGVDLSEACLAAARVHARLAITVGAVATRRLQSFEPPSTRTESPATQRASS